MSGVLDPFRFVLIAVAGWMNQRQLQVIDYLREENRVLREQLGGRRLRLNDDQRRRLAAKAKGLGRKLLDRQPSGFEKRLHILGLQRKAPGNLPCGIKECCGDRGRGKRIRCLRPAPVSADVWPVEEYDFNLGNVGHF